MRLVIAFIAACVAAWFALGLHFVRRPTADQLYGCTIEQQQRTPNGEDCP